MIRHRRRYAVGASVLLFIGALAAGVTSVYAAGQVTATFSKDSDWGTAYQGKYTVTNGTSDTTDRWRVEFDLASGSTVGSSWEADFTRTGNHYLAVSKSYNAHVAPGASATFGFIVNGQGLPMNCTINGAACGGGPGPTTAPPPSPTVTSTTNPPPPPPPPSSSSTTRPPPPPPPPPGAAGSTVLGYFTEWGVYGRNYHVKNVQTSGSADKLTHINYAFGNVQNGQCTLGDTYADYDRFYDAASSVDGIADTWDANALRGNFGQLRRLKKLHPELKVLFSFGGWTWSGGFGQAAANANAFADSCYNLIEDKRWADVFDGIDIDWEYPNACGLSCDTSGQAGFKNLMSALRSRFGSSYLVTAAITADGTSGGKMDQADYAGAARYVNWYNVMTYDFFGAWAAQGPTAPHSPLTSYPGIPMQGFNSDAAISKLRGKGIASNKLLLGIGFYGRGWTGVTQSAPGGSATGPAPGTYEPGVEDYKVIRDRCPATGTVAGTAYAFCGGQWWSYDTPSTIGGKMGYAKSNGLGGSFFWELSGDTSNGELISAIKNGLR